MGVFSFAVIRGWHAVCAVLHVGIMRVLFISWLCLQSREGEREREREREREGERGREGGREGGREREREREGERERERGRGREGEGGRGRERERGREGEGEQQGPVIESCGILACFQTVVRKQWSSQ